MVRLTNKQSGKRGDDDRLRLLTPLVKWPGGKRALINYILPLVPNDFGRYYEPFLGGGALFFAIRPVRAVLADKNAELIHAYKQVRDNPESVIAALRKLKNNEDAYYQVRSWRPRSDAAKAAKLLYLCALSFNGIHRVNLKGVFNVPYGFKVHLNPCAPEKIRATSKLLKKSSLRCQDFELTLKHAAKGDLVYLDPPYTTAHSKNGFVKYNARIFTWDDQQRLSNVAHELASRGCSVIVSNADHPSVLELYREFEVLRINRFSVIAASPDFRRNVSECIFHNTNRPTLSGSD